ncbi:MAG TPA: cytochrome-c peroxidase [Verrucomicrobiae bacterium]
MHSNRINSCQQNLMRLGRGIMTLGAISLCAVLFPERKGSAQYGKEAAQIEARELSEPILPIPQRTALNAEKVALGRKLFHEPVLSKDNSLSCASCHSLKQGGVDHRPHSLGINKAEGPINSPTVFNSGLNFRQFWDGRAESLEEQIEGPTQSPIEMGSNWQEIIKKLNNTAGYRSEFKKIYPDGLQKVNVKNAIAEFERSLLTPNSRFDKYLRGDNTAINASEREGYRKFKSFGCISCHQGVSIGGNMFQKLGIIEDYFKDRGPVHNVDLGRFNVTGDEEDKHVFKVPSLRNVEKTAPYFHDGSKETLEEAVQAMAKYQLGRRLSNKDVEDIVLFLRTLTGEYEGTQL